MERYDYLIFNQYEDNLEKLDSVALCRAVVDQTKAKQYELADESMVMDCLRLAETVHRNDRRTNSPYIDHPMRAALMALMYFNTNPDVVAGCLLHDTVEDHPLEVAELLGGEPIDNGLSVADARGLAFEQLTLGANRNVAAIVKAVTNPVEIMGAQLDIDQKHAIYHSHIRQILNNDVSGQGAAVVKFCDFFDNAIRNHLTTDIAKQNKLDGKYYPLFNNYQDWLAALPDNVIGRNNKKILADLIQQGDRRSVQRRSRVGGSIASLILSGE